MAIGSMLLAAAIIVGGERFAVEGAKPEVKGDAIVFSDAGKAEIAPQEELQFPFAVRCEVVGKDVRIDTAGVAVNFAPHWSSETMGVVRTYFMELHGKSVPLGNCEYRLPDASLVEIVHYSDHSSMRVTDKASGRLYAYAPCILRTGKRNPAMFKVSTTMKGKAAQSPVVKGLAFNRSVKDAAISHGQAVAPDGYRTVFSDRFQGETEKWGARTACPGVFTLPKKTYFSYSYPVLVPGVKIDDGMVRFKVLMEKGVSGSIRFRASEDGDTYLAFRFREGAGNGFAVCGNGKDEKPIGEAGRLDPAVEVEFEVRFNGTALEAYANGKRIAKAQADRTAGGGLYVCGSSSAPTRFLSFDAFAAVDGERTFTDANGKPHRYVADCDFLWYDGIPYIPLIDSDGQYFLRYEKDAPFDGRAWSRLRDRATLADVRRHGLTWQGVFLRLADYVDPTQRDHGFHEDGGIGGESRILEIAGEPFRVTSARRSLLPYFSYTTKCRRPAKMHVVGLLVPNDVERYLGVYPLPAESGSFGVATGRNFPCDNVNRAAYSCYYPRKESTEWIFLSNIFHRDVKSRMAWSERSGGAIGGLWLMELDGDVCDFMPKVTPPKGGPERIFGDYNQRCDFLFRNFGVQASPSAKGEKASATRRAAFASWVDHAKFAGLNHAEVCWLGTDWMLHDGRNNNVGYPSPLFSKYTDYVYDYSKEMMPELAGKGVSTFVSTATFNVRESSRADFGLDESDVRICPNGERAHLFGTGILEPASTRVQDLYVKALDEIAGATANLPNVKGVAISIDGFFSLASGWGEMALAAFERETRIAVPDHTPTNAYEFVMGDSVRRDAWLKWRARQSHALLLRLRDTIRAHNPDWTLLVRFLHQYVYKFRNDLAADQLGNMLDAGINPADFRDDDGILFASRAFYEARIVGEPGTVSFAYEHGVTDVPTKVGTGHHQWTGYWESPGMFPKFSRYTMGWLGDPNTVPVGRTMLETFTYHLANENVRYWVYQAWESAIAGTEHLMRRMGAAYRALPVAEPRPYLGGDVPAGMKVAWYGDRLAVINVTSMAATVRLKVSGDMVELGRGRTYARDGNEISVDVQPYDLLVFGSAE